MSDDDDAQVEGKPDITGLKREDVERPSRANDPYGNPNPRYELPSSPAKMSKPPHAGDHYNALGNSRVVGSSSEGKRRPGWGPARTGIQRTEWSSSPLNPYGRMEYALKNDEYVRFNEEFKRDRAEMTGCVTEAMASADRVLAMRNCFEQR